MLRIKQPKDNAIVVTHQFLKTIGAKVTIDTVEETLTTHPDYPSLLSITEALNEWKIENITASVRPERFEELDSPFLTYLTIDGGIFVMVNSIKDSIIEWSDGISSKTEKLSAFASNCNGVILMAEAGPEAQESDYTLKRKKEILTNARSPLAAAILVVLVASVFYYRFSANISYNLFLITKFSGILVSGLLLWKSIDSNNPFIQKLCLANARNDCNRILNSDAAKVTSWLSWAEAGFFYFAGGFIALVIAPNTIVSFYYVAIIAIGYSLWSVYYQAFVAKQWCTLCLMVQFIVLLEFAISLFSLSTSNSSTIYQPHNLWFLLCGFLTAIVFWMLFKPLFQSRHEIDLVKKELSHFKNNTGIFLNLLQNQAPMKYISPETGAIIWGNPEAEHTITIVTNPLCQPCVNAHKTIHQLLASSPNLNCQVIFSIRGSNQDKREIIARAILSFPEEQQGEALNRWFEDKNHNIEKWQEYYDCSKKSQINTILANQYKWCVAAQIKATPTIYIDGFNLPEIYRLDELARILKHLPTTDFAKS